MAVVAGLLFVFLVAAVIVVQHRYQERLQHRYDSAIEFLVGRTGAHATALRQAGIPVPEPGEPPPDGLAVIEQALDTDDSPYGRHARKAGP